MAHESESSRPARRAVGEWLLEQLYDGIFSGRIPPGTPMGEVELAQKYGVSRSPVRDALRQLESDRLLSTVAANGARVVTEFTSGDIQELYDIRAALESLSFRRAAQLVTAEDVQRLTSIEDRMERAEAERQPDQPRGFSIDVEFHVEVARLSGYPRISDALAPLLSQTQSLLRQMDIKGVYPAGPAEVKAAHEDHRLLLDALMAHNAEDAERALREHLLARCEVLVRGYVSLGRP